MYSVLQKKNIYIQGGKGRDLKIGKVSTTCF
jgi:hypothetical protein